VPNNAGPSPPDNYQIIIAYTSAVSRGPTGLSVFKVSAYSAVGSVWVPVMSDMVRKSWQDTVPAIDSRWRSGDKYSAFRQIYQQVGDDTPSCISTVRLPGWRRHRHPKARRTGSIAQLEAAVTPFSLALPGGELVVAQEVVAPPPPPPAPHRQGCWLWLQGIGKSPAQDATFHLAVKCICSAV